MFQLGIKNPKKIGPLVSLPNDRLLGCGSYHVDLLSLGWLVFVRSSGNPRPVRLATNHSYLLIDEFDWLRKGPYHLESADLLHCYEYEFWNLIRKG